MPAFYNTKSSPLHREGRSLSIIQSSTIEDVGWVEIVSDGEIVWVNGGPAGGSIARFGKRGIDVHTLDTTGCLHCTHEPTGLEDWEIFKAKVLEHHGVEVADEHMPKRLSTSAS